MPVKAARLPKQFFVAVVAIHAGKAKNSKDIPTGASIRAGLILVLGGLPGIWNTDWAAVRPSRVVKA